MLTWLRENRRRPLLAARLGAQRRDRQRLRPDRLPGDDRGRAGPTATATTRSGPSRRCGGRGVPHRLLAGPWVHADPATAYPGPRIDLDREMVAWWDRWLRGRSRTEPHRTGWTCSSAPRRAPSRTSTCTRATGSATPGPRPPRARRTPRARRAALARGRARRRHRGVDRLRRPPAVGPVRRPARRRRPLADLGVAAPTRGAWSGSRVSGCGSAPTPRPRRCRSSSATSSPTAPRRWSRAGSLDLAYRDGRPRARRPPAGARRGVRRGAAARRLRLPARARPPAAAVGRRRGLAEHRRSAGPGHADRARRRRSSCRRGPARRPPGRRPSPPARRRSSEDPTGVTWTVVPRRAAPDHDVRGAPRCGLRRAARRHRVRAVRRGGGRRPAHLRPARRRRVRLPADLARRRRPGHVHDARRRDRAAATTWRSRRRRTTGSEQVSHRTWTEHVPR